jgi:glucose/mannose transport system permease protein
MISLLFHGKRRTALIVGIPAALLLIWYVTGGVNKFPNPNDPNERYGFNVAMIGIIIAAIWQLSGYTMAMYLAGIRGVAEELREAARVDGCSEIQVYSKIVLPLLRPITLSAAIVLGHISLKVFDLIFAMAGTDYLPVSVPGVQVYTITFRSNQFALGSSIAVVLLVMVASVIVPYLITSLRGEHEV